MSVFARLKSKLSSHVTRKSPDSLIIGKQYEIYDFKQNLSEYMDKKTNKHPYNLHCFIKDGNLKYYVIMPNVYNDLPPEDVEELNATIKNGTPPTLCFYGKDDKRNEIAILQHGEGPNVERISELKNKIAESNLKHNLTDCDEGPSPKKSRQA